MESDKTFDDLQNFLDASLSTLLTDISPLEGNNIMISSVSASLVISVAKGAILAGRQIDQLLTLKAASVAEIPGILPREFSDPNEAELEDLQRRLQFVYQSDFSGVLGANSKVLRELKAAVDLQRPLMTPEAKWKAILRQAEIHLPDVAVGTILDPQGQFIDFLRRRRPDLVASSEWTVGAAFMLDGSEMFRNHELLKRCSLIVLDQLFEIGSANSERILSDPQGRKVLEAVLRNLADENLTS